MLVLDQDLYCILHPRILLSTYIEFKCLEGNSEASWYRGIDPEGLLDDTAGVLELLQNLNVKTLALQVHTLLFLG